MGWDGAYHWTTKAIAVADILKEYGSKVEAHAVTRSGLWMAYRYEGKLMLVVDLLEKHGSHYMRKGISEDMWPYCYDCPAWLVAMVPEPKCLFPHDANDPANAQIIRAPGSIMPEHGDTWRSMWRKHEARRLQVKAVKSAMAVGDELTLTNGWLVKVTSLRPLLATDSKGKTWRVPKRLLPA